MSSEYNEGNETNFCGTIDRGQFLPTGLYLYRIQAGKFHDVRKLLVI